MPSVPNNVRVIDGIGTTTPTKLAVVETRDYMLPTRAQLTLDGGVRVTAEGVRGGVQVTRDGDRAPEHNSIVWSGGVGGLELVGSPDGRHVALFVFSGQSSQGYELFTIAPTLARIGGLAQVHGHGDAPRFSPDARWLVALIDQDPRVRSSNDYFEMIQDEYADDRVIVEWARLHVHRIPDPLPVTVAVGVDVPRSTDIDVIHGWRPYDVVSFTSDDTIQLCLPWGDVQTIRLPLTGAITSRLS